MSSSNVSDTSNPSPTMNHIEQGIASMEIDPENKEMDDSVSTEAKSPIFTSDLFPSIKIDEKNAQKLFTDVSGSSTLECTPKPELFTFISNSMSSKSDSFLTICTILRTSMNVFVLLGMDHTPSALYRERKLFLQKYTKALSMQLICRNKTMYVIIEDLFTDSSYIFLYIMKEQFKELNMNMNIIPMHTIVPRKPIDKTCQLLMATRFYLSLTNRNISVVENWACVNKEDKPLLEKECIKQLCGLTLHKEPPSISYTIPSVDLIYAWMMVCGFCKEIP